MEIAALYIYPVKSCGGFEVEAMELLPHGPRFDREFMVVDAEGVFLSQRNVPQMCLIRVAIRNNFLILRNTGHQELWISLERKAGPERIVRVHADTCTAVDMGNAAARFFTSFLGQTCRLVRYTTDQPRIRHSSALDQEISVGFADGYPLLVVSEESLADLNQRLVALGESPVSMDRFRPNIVVRGCPPYAEDHWPEIRTSGIVLKGANCCIRCVIPATDQETGERGKEPNRTLATYRSIRDKEGNRVVIFGRNFVHLNTGTLHNGDLVEVITETPERR